ncbi:MAG: PolC-type DNA polymerase III [Bacilli bacterium]|nr:PolC-type DNA polymerase III [Bacilli bacterium]
MDKNLEKLLKQINFPEEKKELFVNAKLAKIIRNHEKTKCLFVIALEKMISYQEYLFLEKLLVDKFFEIDEVKCELTLETYTEDDILMIFKEVMKYLALTDTTLNLFLNNPIKINENNIEFQVSNIIEEKQMNLYGQKIIDNMKLVGFDKVKFEIVIEKSLNEEIKNQINEDLNKDVAIPVFKEKPQVSEEPKKRFYSKRIFRIDDERVIMGNVIENTAVTLLKTVPVDINDVDALEKIKAMEEIVVEAKVFGMEVIESRKKPGLRIVNLKITDNMDSIYAKTFIEGDDDFKAFSKSVKEGKWYKFKGSIKYDEYAKEITFSLTDINFFEKKEFKRVDNAPRKRIELHAHTMMSQMDGVADEVALIKTAASLGHLGIAITDHDGCQAFPHVYGEIGKYNKGLKAPYKELIAELEAKLNEASDEEKIKITAEIQEKKEAMKKLPLLKGMYGVELEMSLDSANIVVNPTDADLFDSTYVVFDTETTGFNPGLHDSMIEIGAVKMKDGNVIDRFDELINPGHPIDESITNLTGITDEMVANSLSEKEATIKFKEWIGDLPLVAHNAKFDKDMLEMAYYKYDLGTLTNPIVDTWMLSKAINKDCKKHGLTALAKFYHIKFAENVKSDDEEEEATSAHHHRADYDAEATGSIFYRMLKKINKMETIKTLKQLSEIVDIDETNQIVKEHHVNLIARSKKGLKNLFKLISFANTKYLVKSARIPKWVIAENREDVLVGSGCMNSEIFSVALSRPDEDLKKVMEFYDYIEVQPPSNYEHLVFSHDISNYEDLIFALNKIIRCARELGKIVVATSDSHTLTKEDTLYREFIVNQNVPGKGRHPLARYLNKEGYNRIPPQYFRTTEEMLEEFSFLPEDIREEIVIDNTHKIADMCEEYEVVEFPDKPYSPVIPDSQKTTTELVYAKAQSWYGNPLPLNIEERIAKELYGDAVYRCCKEIVEANNTENIEEKTFEMVHKVIEEGFEAVKKLIGDNLKAKDPSLADQSLEKAIEKELGGIIGGGFDVIYLIAQKLVKHSNDDGYLVGSRGSVGSSFVATMMGITEVNPLPAHYRCLKCQHSIFTDENGNALGATYSSGFDLPDKNCPVCGERLHKDGQDMPFATFLGFNADKVPDIDLNFSDLNQADAHNYTKVLFGEDNVYRAGTIGTVADKTAYGYVKGFYEDRGIKKRSPEIERLAVGCTGVKRTTGQHPGGIVVVPDYRDVYDFTPYQFPADDKTAEWRTTHFDYHAIDQDLLKLDILGHSDPTQLRYLQDMTGMNVTDVPLDDKETMAIFLSPKPLGVTEDQIMCPTGTLGIPEFGTNFTIGMLTDTKPTTFSELIKISGLSHGTDVWLGNAQELIRNNVVPFKEVIGCRDDIMVYLMYKGLAPIKAFKIMEFVRKGKASKEPDTWAEHKETMKKAGIEDWFIDSCGKIKYMFPKAHAAAYVISAFRIAWFKVHKPVYYYATYLSARITDYDIGVMCKGYNAIKNRMLEITAKGKEATNKELAVLETLKIALEATARGIKFAPIDINKSEANTFVVKDETTVYPPFSTIDGLGDAVALTIIEERKIRPFSTIEDLQKRGKVSQTIIETMRNLGILNGMDESNQLSLF